MAETLAIGQRKNTRFKIADANTRLVGCDARKCISMSQSGHCSGLVIFLLKVNNTALIPPEPVIPYQDLRLSHLNLQVIGTYLRIVASAGVTAKFQSFGHFLSSASL